MGKKIVVFLRNVRHILPFHNSGNYSISSTYLKLTSNKFSLYFNSRVHCVSKVYAERIDSARFPYRPSRYVCREATNPLDTPGNSHPPAVSVFQLRTQTTVSVFQLDKFPILIKLDDCYMYQSFWMRGQANKPEFM